MNRDASQIAPPGYFDRVEQERLADIQRQLDLSPQELLLRIEKLEAILNSMGNNE